MSKYKNPFQNSENNNMCWSKTNVSNNGKKITPYHPSFFKVPFIFLCFYIKNNNKKKLF